MRLLISGLFITLDGVVEDPHSWNPPYYNHEMTAAVQCALAASDTHLYGRRSYEMFRSVFTGPGSERIGHAPIMNDTPKVLVSTTIAETAWGETTVIAGDVAARIRELKQRPGGTINVQASPTLVRFLLGEGLLDELHLLIHPVIVGTGRRLFDGVTGPASFDVIEVTQFTTGVMSLRLAPTASSARRSASTPTAQIRARRWSNHHHHEHQERSTDMNTVTSTDGSTIAYDRSGEGPPVILVNGALGDRKLDRRFKQMIGLAELLSPSHTVINYDRRGRGNSDEAGPFAVEREIDDIAALITTVGDRAALFGFSSGGALALRAAGAGIGVERVAVYEAPFMVDRAEKHPPADYGQRLAGLIAAGDSSGAVRLFMRNAMGMPAPVVAMMRLMPMWKDMTANAHTLSYDWVALGEHNMQGDPLMPAEWASVRVPALVVHGGKSPANLTKGARALADVLPNAQLRSLDGVGHNLKVKRLAPVLTEFLDAGDHGGNGQHAWASRVA